MKNSIADGKYVQNTLIKHEMATIVAVLGVTISTFGNTLLAGRFIGKSALAAMNILSSFTFLYAMIGCLVSVGAASKAAVALGKHDYDMAGKYEKVAFGLSIIIPTIISAICLINLRWFMSFLGFDNELYMMSVDYGKVVLVGGIFNTLMYFPFNFLRIDGRAKYSMWIFSLMGVLDLILVYVLLSLGFGLTGVAMGNVLSMMIADFIGLAFIFSKKSNIHMVKLEKKDIVPITGSALYAGSASGLNNLCKVFRTIWLNSLVLRFLGTDGVSVLAIGCAIINFASAAVTGFGMAMYPLVGVLYGEHDSDGQKKVMNGSLKNSSVVMISLGIVLCIFAENVARAFGITEPELIGQAALMIRLVAISLIPATYMNEYIYYYTAIGENVAAMTFTVLHSFILVVLMISAHLRIDASTWYGVEFIFVEFVDFAILWGYSKYKRAKDHNLKTILLTPKRSDEIFFSAVSSGTYDDNMALVEKVEDFCRDNKVSFKGIRIPMVVEEISILMANHCLKEDYTGIDVKISVLRNTIIVRTRCGGEMFNPVTWFAHEEEIDSDSEELFGMRMVDKMATDIRYTQLFGLNNVIVTMEGHS